MQTFFTGAWMKQNILQGHGPLCSLYRAHSGGSEGFDDGDFRSEGDSPAFMHAIGTGLRNMESPDYGGWGGRYVRVRENTWLDPVPVEGYTYPDGRWYSGSAWGREKQGKKRHLPRTVFTGSISNQSGAGRMPSRMILQPGPIGA